MSSAFPIPDSQPVDLDETAEFPSTQKVDRDTAIQTRVHARAKAHGVSPSVVKVGDVMRLGFLACYVLSATVSQIATGALLVYLIPI